MKQEQTQDKVFNRRAAILAAGQLTVFLGLNTRMYYLQVIEANRYRVLAEENRISLRLLPPPRGEIIDRKDRPLAVNVQIYRLVIVPEQAKNVGEMLTGYRSWLRSALMTAVGCVVKLNVAVPLCPLLFEKTYPGKK